jgi:hypothetical protein
MRLLTRVGRQSSVTQDNETKQSGLSAWSWKRRRLFRARIRSRYEHVAQRGWHFHGIIYIPAVAERHIPKTKRAHGAFVIELERLAALNVPWACAILSYYALLLREDGSRDIERAVSLCQEPARAGDAYAQYMLSWALRLKGDLQGSYRNLKKSARLLFPPAVLDIAGFYDPDWDAATINRERRLRLTISDRVGHVLTGWRRLQFYRTGRFGALSLMLGYLLVPYAFVKAILPVACSPFSAAVFVFDRRLSTKPFDSSLPLDSRLNP